MPLGGEGDLAGGTDAAADGETETLGTTETLADGASVGALDADCKGDGALVADGVTVTVALAVSDSLVGGVASGVQDCEEDAVVLTEAVVEAVLVDEAVVDVEGVTDEDVDVEAVAEGEGDADTVDDADWDGDEEANGVADEVAAAGLGVNTVSASCTSSTEIRPVPMIVNDVPPVRGPPQAMLRIVGRATKLTVTFPQLRFRPAQDTETGSATLSPTKLCSCGRHIKAAAVSFHAVHTSTAPVQF